MSNASGFTSYLPATQKRKGKFPKVLSKRESQVVHTALASGRPVFSAAELVAAVTQAAPGDCIVLGPQSYVMTSQLVIDKYLFLIAPFGPALITSSSTSFAPVLIQPGDDQTTMFVVAKNIYFSTSGLNMNALEVNVPATSTLTSQLVCRFENCDFEYKGSGTGVGLLVKPTSRSKGVHIEMACEPFQKVTGISFAAAVQTDSLTLSGGILSAGGTSSGACLVTGATAVRIQVKVWDAELPLHLFTAAGDGNAAHLIQLLNCKSNTSGTYAAAVTADSAGSQTCQAV